MINYRPLIDSKLEEFQQKMPEYTFAQTVYAMLLHVPTTQTFKKSELLNLTDEKVYKALCVAVDAENDN